MPKIIKNDRIVDDAAGAEPMMCRSMSLVKWVNRSTPRTLLPCWSSRGEKVAMPSCPGSAPIRPPATPLLAGMPTWVAQSPAASYMPHVDITLST